MYTPCVGILRHLYSLIRCPVLLYTVAFTFIYMPALCLCRTTTRAPPVFCSRPQLNINIRGSNMRHRVVRVIDTVIGVVFWSSVTVVVLYSGFSKRMCSKRNQMWVFVNNTPCPPPTTRDVSARNHYGFHAIAKYLRDTRLKLWELSPQTPTFPIYTTCRSTSCMWRWDVQFAKERAAYTASSSDYHERLPTDGLNATTAIMREWCW